MLDVTTATHVMPLRAFTHNSCAFHSFKIFSIPLYPSLYSASSPKIRLIVLVFCIYFYNITGSVTANSMATLADPGTVEK